MSERELKIVGVGRMNEHAVMVEYSDNTTAIYSVEQLASLVPIEIVTGEKVEEDPNRRFRWFVTDAISTSNVR